MLLNKTYPTVKFYSVVPAQSVKKKKITKTTDESVFKIIIL